MLCTLLGAWPELVALVPVAAAPVTASMIGRRWRLSDLGAGEELRRHELDRRWLWEPAPALPAGERSWIGPQAEIIRRRPWPAHVGYVAMTRDEDAGARLPLGEGRHVFI